MGRHIDVSSLIFGHLVAIFFKEKAYLCAHQRWPSSRAASPSAMCAMPDSTRSLSASTTKEPFYNLRALLCLDNNMLLTGTTSGYQIYLQGQQRHHRHQGGGRRRDLRASTVCHAYGRQGLHPARATGTPGLCPLDGLDRGIYILNEKKYVVR